MKDTVHLTISYWTIFKDPLPPVSMHLQLYTIASLISLHRDYEINAGIFPVISPTIT